MSNIDFKRIKKTFTYGNQEVTLETGMIARQASGAVMIRMGDTVVLVTAVGVKKAVDRDFFPLTVNYQEKSYAAGRIPGGYFKREGRPTEKETLTSRLIDRPIRPLFPKGFKNEVQVVATVMSVDTLYDPDIAALIGASAALAISGLPFQGPIGAARIGYSHDGRYLLNPSYEELEESTLDMVVAGTENAVLMVESEAVELSEEIMLGAVVFGHEHMQVAIKAIKELASEVGTTAWDWETPAEDEALNQRLAELAEQSIAAAYRIPFKQERQSRLEALRAEVLAQLLPEITEAVYNLDAINKGLDALEKRLVRERILTGAPRIDGRDIRTVRALDVQLGILPRAHGSAVFTRGETQAIVVATLGTERDAQTIDALEGEQKAGFMLHYNFPPYSVGEAGMMSGPKRREIGHGRLAWRAMQAILPDPARFNYTIRIVSEITESNGSSSMATVCGASLALMDAGVPTRAPVAGIAMGLVKEGNRFAVLTDILGDEDHLGDMDFKVAGTAEGITALQMDIKIDGITSEIMRHALAQAKDARLHILGVMNQHINVPRQDISQHAPRIYTIKIPMDKIRDVIGKGGIVIRSIIEETGATVEIDDSGLVKIAAVNSLAAQDAIERIKELTATPEVGAVYTGKVVKIVDFGAFVSILPGCEGLVHISQISNDRINAVSDVLEEGQIVKVKVLEIDRQGRVRLSMKEVDQVPTGA